MIKHYIGNSPQEHIQQLIVQLAKNKLRNTQLSVSEIAYRLGFDYPTYFTRLFKKTRGITPNVFRSVNCFIYTVIRLPQKVLNTGNFAS